MRARVRVRAPVLLHDIVRARQFPQHIICFLLLARACQRFNNSFSHFCFDVCSCPCADAPPPSQPHIVRTAVV